MQCNVCVGVWLCVCGWVCLFVCLLVCLFACRCLSVCVGVCRGVSVCVCACFSVSLQPDGAAHHRRFSHGLISNFGASVVHRLSRRGPFSQTVQLPVTNTSSSTHEDNNPQSSVSPFLPEFPLRKFPGKNQFQVVHRPQNNKYNNAILKKERGKKKKLFIASLYLQVLGFIAKGSFGPILKIKDVSIDKIFAIKSLSQKVKLTNHLLSSALCFSLNAFQRQLKHPFIHNLQDCWQTQHHLFISEFIHANRFLNDLGIMHRDIKMDNILLSDRGHLRMSDFGLSRRLKRGGRTFTICGTIQYMGMKAYRVISSAADNVTVRTTTLPTGGHWFPVPPESGHIAMLNKVRQCPYVIPTTCSTALTILLTELLSKNPVNRLRNLDCFQMQAFFRGTSFDSEILQKTPNEVILKLRTHPDWSAKAMRGITVDYLKNFDHNKVWFYPIYVIFFQ
uniref:Protein kinase domain-containing protein n=1 Tax=Periophthalmus magnuspinnatus TaxID=409849 RepID=A0A3B4AFV7_9GOBI